MNNHNTNMMESSLPYVLNVAKSLALLEHRKLALMKEISSVRKQIKAIKLEGRLAGIPTDLAVDGPSIYETVGKQWEKFSGSKEEEFNIADFSGKFCNCLPSKTPSFVLDSSSNDSVHDLKFFQEHGLDICNNQLPNGSSSASSFVYCQCEQCIAERKEAGIVEGWPIQFKSE